MRTLLHLIILAIFLLAQTGYVWAESQTFIVTADVPEVIDGGIIEEGIIGQSKGRPDSWDFGTLVFDQINNIWTVDDEHGGYYIALLGTVTLTYADTNNPNTAAGYSGHGLGYKAVIGVKEVINTTTEVNVTGYPEGVRPIRNISGHTFTPALLHGHPLKLYVGIYDGNENVSHTPDVEFFTNADHGGTYQGTLTITVVTS